jgi:trans-aconitate methyltransferase
MPKWLKKEISDKKLSICDLGCGMGEGVNLFKSYFNDSEITGVDFLISLEQLEEILMFFDCVILQI